METIVRTQNERKMRRGETRPETLRPPPPKGVRRAAGRPRRRCVSRVGAVRARRVASPGAMEEVSRICGSFRTVSHGCQARETVLRARKIVAQERK